MVGIKIQDSILKDELLKGLKQRGYMAFDGMNGKLDLNVVQGIENDFNPSRVFILTDDINRFEFENYCFKMSEKSEYCDILDRIELLVEKDVDYGEKISKILLDVGILPLKKGYGFLKDAINIYINHSDFKIKDIYDLVGLYNGSNKSGVERNIRYAIEAAFNKGRTESYERIFKNSVNPLKGKPTNMEFICLVSDIVKFSV